VPGVGSGRDHAFMQRALQLARHGASRGEVPVGALLVRGEEVLAEAWNRPIGESDPSAHAEMLALCGAARRLGNYRVLDSTLYVTMEPCVMCAGAIVHARVARVVYGAPDERWGGCGSVLDVLAPGRWNHDVQIRSGLMAEECAALLREFFQARRTRRKAPCAPGFDATGESGQDGSGVSGHDA